MSYNFKFGKYWISEFGAIVSTPDYEIAERDGEMVEIPGKDGAEYIDNGRYKNVEFSRSVSMLDKNGFTAREKALNIISEYMPLYGYQDFEDTDHPDMITQAKLQNFGDVNREFRVLNSATLKFSRKPYWHLKSGLNETVFDLENPTISLINPFNFDSAPLIRFTLKNASSGTAIIVFTVTNNGNTKTYTYYVNRGTYPGNVVLEIDGEKRVGRLIKAGAVIGYLNYSDTNTPTFETGETTLEITNKNYIDGAAVIPRWRCL